MLDGVRNVVKFGLPLADAVYAASSAPAQAVGLTDVGSVQVGKCADLVMLDKDLNLLAVYVNGEKQ
jgi:N-acetylglucosamine-6-phosphate deacetylase